MSLGLQVATKRKILHLSQQALAKKLGIDKSSLSRLESGKIKRPSTEILNKLSKILHEPVSYFYEEEPKVTVPTTQNFPLIVVTLQVEPKHIKIIEEMVRNLLKEFRKETGKRPIMRKKLF